MSTNALLSFAEATRCDCIAARRSPSQKIARVEDDARAANGAAVVPVAKPTMSGLRVDIKYLMSVDIKYLMMSRAVWEGP
jgi:hypothetical protein